MQLLGNILHLSGLDVESALVDVRGAEGTYAWLVALSGCKVVGACILQEFFYALDAAVGYRLHLRDVDQGQLLRAVFKAGCQGCCGVKACEHMHAGLDGVTADDKSVAASLCALLRNVDDQIDLMTQDQVP